MTNPVWGSVGTLASGTTGAVTPVAPSHVAGDYLLIASEYSNSVNNITPTLGGGTAFTLLDARISGSSVSGLAVWGALATGAGMTIPALGGNVNQDHLCAVVIVISGCQNTVGDNPWSNTAGINLSATAQTAVTGGNLGSVNATNALIVDIISRGNDVAIAQFSAWANAGLANVTERFDLGTQDGGGGGLGISSGDLAAPATLSPTTATCASVRWASFSLAFRSTAIGTATITGVSKTGSAGTISAKGAASATITGVSRTSAVGSITANGAANASLTGTQASGAVGSLVVGAGASAALVGVGATGSAGTIVALAGTVAPVTGVEAVGSVGTIHAVGGEAPPWELQIAGFGPVRPQGAVVRLRSASARARVGRISAYGRASVALQGAQARGLVGEMMAFGMTRTFSSTVPMTKAAAQTLRGWESAMAYRRKNEG